MQKIRFHNSKIVSEYVDEKKTNQTQNLNPKIVVDINKLLNRVKIEERNDIKKKFFLFSVITLSLTFMGIFIAIIK